MARREFGPTLRIREGARAESRVSRRAGSSTWHPTSVIPCAPCVETLGSQRRLSAVSRLESWNRGQHRSLQPYDGCSVQPTVLQGIRAQSVTLASEATVILKYRRGAFSMTPTLFPDIAGAQEMAEANLRVGSVTARLWEVRVTPNFFEAMGVPVAKGQR
jgi:hypothetical protein